MGYMLVSWPGCSPCPRSSTVSFWPRLFGEAEGKQVSKTKASKERVRFTCQRCDCLVPAACVCRRGDHAGLPSFSDPYCLAYHPCSKSHYPGSNLLLHLLHISLPSHLLGAGVVAGRSRKAAASSSSSKTSAPPCAESWKSCDGTFSLGKYLLDKCFRDIN